MVNVNCEAGLCTLLFNLFMLLFLRNFNVQRTGKGGHFTLPMSHCRITAKQTCANVHARTHTMLTYAPTCLDRSGSLSQAGVLSPSKDVHSLLVLDILRLITECIVRTPLCAAFLKFRPFSEGSSLAAMKTTLQRNRRHSEGTKNSDRISELHGESHMCEKSREQISTVPTNHPSSWC